MIYIQNQQTPQTILVTLARNPLQNTPIRLAIHGEVGDWEEELSIQSQVSPGGSIAEVTIASMPEDTELGSYGFILWQESGGEDYILAQGVLQVGDFDPENKQYSKEIEIKQYETN